MKFSRGTIGIVVVAACAVFGAGACSSSEATSSETATSAVEGVPDGRPKAPPVKLPPPWGTTNTGLFKFSGESTVFTENGILTLGAAGGPVLWSWSGEPTVLEPEFQSGEGKIRDSFIVQRDGRAYAVSLWYHTEPVEGNTLGNGTSTSGMTTWDDTGKVVFEGPYDSLEDVTLYQIPSRGVVWTPLTDGLLLNPATSTDVLLDPLTGKVEFLPTKDYRKATTATIGGNVVASGSWMTKDKTATFTNTKTGDTLEVSADEADCKNDVTRDPLEAIASVDGRYIVSGYLVIDMKDKELSCLDSSGSPTITAIGPDGIGYGEATQNAEEVVISYDLESEQITVHPDAMAAPVFIGPSEQAVVEPSTDNGIFGVYVPESA